MAKFIGIHKMPSVGDEDMQKAWSAYKEACSKNGIKALRANYNATAGVAVCETEAANADQVKVAHEEAGNVPEIFEVKTAE